MRVLIGRERFLARLIAQPADICQMLRCMSKWARANPGHVQGPFMPVEEAVAKKAVVPLPNAVGGKSYRLFGAIEDDRQVVEAGPDAVLVLYDACRSSPIVLKDEEGKVRAQVWLPRDSEEPFLQLRDQKGNRIWKAP